MFGSFAATPAETGECGGDASLLGSSDFWEFDEQGFSGDFEHGDVALGDEIGGDRLFPGVGLVSLAGSGAMCWRSNSLSGHHCSPARYRATASANSWSRPGRAR